MVWVDETVCVRKISKSRKWLWPCHVYTPTDLVGTGLLINLNDLPDDSLNQVPSKRFGHFIVLLQLKPSLPSLPH